MNTSVINLGIRGSTLFLRFALTFYIVSYLGLEAAGLYGLAVGAAGMAPALVGWGLNYYVSRHIVGQEPHRAIALIRRRLAITILSLTALSCLALPILLMMAGPLQHIYFLILILMWAETFALDIYMPMIGLELIIPANIMVFVRSAGWIPIVAGLGVFWPEFRSLEFIFICWIASHLVALALLPFFLRHWPVREWFHAPVQAGWARERITRYWYIYLSDISIVGGVYLDRYVVSFMLGLAPTGVYSFYWSIANALQTLIMTAVVQVAMPSMVKAFRSPDGHAWRKELRHQMMKTLGFAFVLAIPTFILTELIIRFSPPDRFPAFHMLFILLLIAAVVRSCSDLLNVAITSSGNDKSYAATNFVGLIVAVVSSLICLKLFGLIGAGISSLLTATILVMIRFVYLRRWWGRRQPGPIVHTPEAG